MPAPHAPTDHRTRTGRERRDRMRTRILRAALPIFAAHGERAVIDDFIRAADIARGTFYNHFRSTQALLEATQQWLENDLILSIQGEIAGFANPADRVGMGVRWWLRRARQDPAWCAFTVRLRHHGELVERQVRADLRDGLARSVFHFASVDVARDQLVGTVQETMYRMTQRAVSLRHVDDVARTVLRALGTSPAMVEAVVARPLGRMRRPALSVAVRD
ncbi:MAG: helix-turn-helix transcriptional regulator [Proteobacteria bacterium]|nr:helix-turn-helix transcriptional regulator [Pseudomonadota bacterium]